MPALVLPCPVHWPQISDSQIVAPPRARPGSNRNLSGDDESDPRLSLPAARRQESARHGDPLEPRYRYDVPVAAAAAAAAADWTVGRVDAARVARLSGGALFHDTPGGRGDRGYRESMLRTDGERGRSPERAAWRAPPFPSGLRAARCAARRRDMAARTGPIG